MLTQDETLRLLEILENNFKGDRKIMANYILNNLPTSSKQMNRNRQLKKQISDIIPKLYKLFENSRSVTLTDLNVKRNTIKLDFINNTGYISLDYFRRKLGSITKYSNLKETKFSKTIHVSFDLGVYDEDK